MKKKLTALFLAVVMCMTMSAPAFAVESTSVAAGREDYPYAVIDYNDAENRVFDYYPSH